MAMEISGGTSRLRVTIVAAATDTERTEDLYLRANLRDAGYVAPEKNEVVAISLCLRGFSFEPIGRAEESEEAKVGRT